MEPFQILTETLRDGVDGSFNKTYKQRLTHLQLLENVIRQNERFLVEALKEDLQKPEFESLYTELLPFYMEIKHFKKNLKRYMQGKEVETPLTHFPAHSEIHYEAKGIVFIIGAWNYPVNLVLLPLVGALAAGNVVLLKPSEVASKTSTMLARLLNRTFDEHILRVVEGGADVTQKLLTYKFDHIFYTGSTSVGKIIYEAAAKQLTPVTLELGGKSPVIVDEKANLDKAVKRILWGKFLNAGQTCVAPDYLFFPATKKQEFQELVKKYAEEFAFEDRSKSTHIINQKHFLRLISYLSDNEHFIRRGTVDLDDLWMSMHIVEITDYTHPLMKEEIFGPILPVYFYKDIEEFYDFYQHNPNPLSFYIFSTRKKFIQPLLAQYPAGGVSINETITHLAQENLPFGGRGASGFGNYHGFSSFRCFSHEKSVLWQKNRMVENYRYPEYSDKKLRFLKKLIKFFG